MSLSRLSLSGLCLSGLCPVWVVSVRVPSCPGCLCPGCVVAQGGGAEAEKTYTGRGGTLHMWRTIRGDTAQHCKKQSRLTVAEPMSWLVGCGAYICWRAHWVIIVSLRGSILQAETCKILCLADSPRWSRVWQYYPFVAPSCKLELARFSAWLRQQEQQYKQPYPGPKGSSDL